MILRVLKQVGVDFTFFSSTWQPFRLKISFKKKSYPLWLVAHTPELQVYTVSKLYLALRSSHKVYDIGCDLDSWRIHRRSARGRHRWRRSYHGGERERCQVCDSELIGPIISTLDSPHKLPLPGWETGGTYPRRNFSSNTRGIFLLCLLPALSRSVPPTLGFSGTSHWNVWKRTSSTHSPIGGDFCSGLSWAWPMLMQSHEQLTMWRSRTRSRKL